MRAWNRPRCDTLIGLTKVGKLAFSYAPVVRSRFVGFMLLGFNYGIHANSQRERLAIICLASIVSETVRGMLSATCAVQVATSKVT